jgi:hypothetical protein
MNITYKKKKDMYQSNDGDNKLISKGLSTLKMKYIVYMLIGRYEFNI